MAFLRQTKLFCVVSSAAVHNNQCVFCVGLHAPNVNNALVCLFPHALCTTSSMPYRLTFARSTSLLLLPFVREGLCCQNLPLILLCCDAVPFISDRIQRGDCGVQEHLIHSLGRRYVLRESACSQFVFCTLYPLLQPVPGDLYHDDITEGYMHTYVCFGNCLVGMHSNLLAFEPLCRFIVVLQEGRTRSGLCGVTTSPILRASSLSWTATTETGVHCSSSSRSRSYLCGSASFLDSNDRDRCALFPFIKLTLFLVWLFCFSSEQGQR